MLICPLCQQPLSLNVRTYRCEQGHSYDVAKEGYVNLLLVQKKKAKQPGDNKAMLQSRRQFLNGGYYQPIVDALETVLPSDPTASILDLGCGEGYYSHALAQRVPSPSWSVLDIAKPGVQMAAKRQFAEHAVVASAYDLPFEAQSFDAILCVFSPFSAEALLRVMKPNTRFVLVGPAENHLRQLAEKIYHQVTPHSGNTGELQHLRAFTHTSTQRITFDLILQGEAINHLFAMTPYYWQSTPEQQAAINGLSTLTVTIDVTMDVFQAPSDPH